MLSDSVLSVDLNFEAMEGLIGDRGVPVVHEISILCPCVSKQPVEGAVGQPDPSCEKCFGGGFLYREPTEILGLISNLMMDRRWAQVGWLQPGDLTFSPSLHARRISDWDRITLLLPVPTDAQIITRGQATSITPRALDLQSNEDLLYWESGRKEPVWVEDVNGVSYNKGECYLHGRRIVWVDGAGPIVGTTYSIKYEAYPEYICWTTPLDRWDRDRELGQRVLLRKAVMETNPARRVVRPPAEERIENLPFGLDKSYSRFGFLGDHKISSPR